jgi:aldehyde:ferredoxin oxidoreductase
MFGNNLLNDNVESVIKANYICNDYGLDTISAGAAVSFAFECYENGLITKEDTGGLELTWGDHKAIIQLTEMIGKREGIGDLLAEGTKVAAERLGGNASDYTIHAGGQDLPAHDPRYAPTFAVNYETDATPGRHTQFGLALIEMGIKLKGIDIPEMDKYQIEGKGELNAKLLNMKQAIFSTGFCSFVFQKFELTVIPEIINAVTGWDYTFESMVETGARIGALRQAFNIREGAPVTEFRMSGRATGHPPATEGPLAGITIDTDTQRRETYQARGWNPETGKPLKKTLRTLGLDDVADDLYS